MFLYYFGSIEFLFLFLVENLYLVMVILLRVEKYLIFSHRGKRIRCEICFSHQVFTGFAKLIRYYTS